MHIYRHINEATFETIINEKRLKFTKPHHWEDPYENTLFKLMAIDNYRVKIIEKINNSNLSEPVIRTAVACLVGMEEFVYCQCWTKTKESDALWRSYSYEKEAIKICIDDCHITNDEFIEGRIHRVDVEYVEHISLDRILDEYINGFKNGSAAMALKSFFKYKRSDFSYENEVRFIIMHTNDFIDALTSSLVGSVYLSNLIQYPSNQKFYDLLKQMIIDEIVEKNELKIHRNKFLDVKLDGEIGKIVNNVIVHPLACDKYVDKIHRKCSINSIPYYGKSKLYTFDF